MKIFLSLMVFASAASAAEPITHRFLVTSGQTYIREADGTISWSYPHPTRDGWVLPNGNVLLALNKDRTITGGAIAEVAKDGKIAFQFKGTQSEVNTAQKVADGRYMLTEAGDKPRLLEVTADGKIALEFPLQAQTKDHHLQTRMARKLKNGNYLVPQLLDRVVREYTAEGKIVWEAKTPNMAFTAIRLPDGNTLVGCTHGNLVVEFDKDGKIVWQVTNDDLPGKPIKDCCGVQRLPNGNTVITSYAAKAGDVKLMEITRDKKIVWSHSDEKRPGIHEFQILDTNGKALGDSTMR